MITLNIGEIVKCLPCYCCAKHGVFTKSEAVYEGKSLCGKCHYILSTMYDLVERAEKRIGGAE